MYMCQYITTNEVSVTLCLCSSNNRQDYWLVDSIMRKSVHRLTLVGEQNMVKFCYNKFCYNGVALMELTLKVLVATTDAQWEGMGDVGSARYEPALLSPMPDHKGFKLQELVNFQKFSTLRANAAIPHLASLTANSTLTATCGWVDRALD